MSDHLTPTQRHNNMSAIRAKNTKPEMLVRKYLWSHGFRYRLNYKRLPGKPDIVLRKYRTCVFVNGCFWHGHKLRFGLIHNDDDYLIFPDSSECCRIPKTNTEFWLKKIKRNCERDKEILHKLVAMGWHCITLWECQLRSSIREQTLVSLAFTLNHIFLENNKVKRYEIPEENAYSMVAEDSEDYINPQLNIIKFEEEIVGKNIIPVYTIRAACGKFLYNDDVDVLGWIDADEYNLRYDKNYYIVQAVGDSMEPIITGGDYCLFEAKRKCEDGDIILAEIPDRDMDYGGSYTIKKYKRTKAVVDGIEQRVSATLIPLNKEYEEMYYDLSSPELFGCAGVFKKVISEQF